jgi:hypothetical protein
MRRRRRLEFGDHESAGDVGHRQRSCSDDASRPGDDRGGVGDSGIVDGGRIVDCGGVLVGCGIVDSCG